MKILFAHGWGLGPWLWSPVLRELAKAPGNPFSETTCLDFGFFGPPRLPSGHFDVAVGHSFGLLWLLHQEQVTFDRVVSINGFTRFFADREFRCGTSPRVVDRMARKLHEAPLQVLEDFLRTCGAEPDLIARQRAACEASCDVERLAWGLSGLNNWDHRSQWEQLRLTPPRCRVMASTGDRVVSEELTRACFGNHEIHWRPSGSHLLPLASPELCAQTLLQMTTPG
jgi:pimeloyl-[acyl-carrier protein] methyl ester esterase